MHQRHIHTHMQVHILQECLLHACIELVLLLAEISELRGDDANEVTEIKGEVVNHLLAIVNRSALVQSSYRNSQETLRKHTISTDLKQLNIQRRDARQHLGLCK